MYYCVHKLNCNTYLYKEELEHFNWLRKLYNICFQNNDYSNFCQGALKNFKYTFITVTMSSKNSK